MQGSPSVAIDVGGTFVDAISFDPITETSRAWKSPTTPSQPSAGVLAAIRGLGYPLGTIKTIVHGTTLGLNAILQRRGAAVGLITNLGFEDVLEVARAEVPARAMYDFGYARPRPIVPRRFRRGVAGRITAEGEELVALDEEAVVSEAAALVAAGRQALAICFLHSYANSAHEERAGTLVRNSFPELPVSLSVHVAREYREYERTMTTVLDALIRPVLEEYFKDIERALREDGFVGSFHVMRSGGGAMTLELARDAPLTTVLSGPAGGIAGTAWLGTETAFSQLISFDVGGTSADICVVEDGVPHHAYEARIDDLPLLLRVFDIRTIGAGGGSIAAANNGLLRVGPTSAGAVPGPACYGEGGTAPTVTDAALVLGMIGSDEFLDGRMPLDEKAAKVAIGEVAEALGLDIVQAAAGIIRVTTVKMVGSLREITAERGLDPRDFALLAFGGAGPLLGPIVATEMGIALTVVPISPALFSAWGMLTTDLEYDVSRSAIAPLEQPGDVEAVQAVLSELQAVATKVLAERAGCIGSVVEYHTQADVRYRGQEYGLSVDVGVQDSTEAIRTRFAELHQRRHGHGIPEDMEVVACRVRATIVVPKPTLASLGRPVGAGSLDQAMIARRQIYDFATGTTQVAPVYRRADLRPGWGFAGPAIVTEGTSTTVVQSDQELEVDGTGLLLVRRA